MLVALLTRPRLALQGVIEAGHTCRLWHERQELRREVAQVLHAITSCPPEKFAQAMNDPITILHSLGREILDLKLPYEARYRKKHARNP